VIVTQEPEHDDDVMEDIDGLVDLDHLTKTRVRRGISYLNIHHPEWLERVTQIPMDHPALKETVYANVFPTFEGWHDLALNRSGAWMVWRGFAPDFLGSYGPQYDHTLLSVQWLAEIARLVDDEPDEAAL
jgi:hypothetical protein